MAVVTRRLLLGSLFGALVVMAVPVVGAFHELGNPHVVLPDGRIDDAAEKGALMFLFFMAVPSAAMLFCYFGLLLRVTAEGDHTYAVVAGYSNAIVCAALAIGFSLVARVSEGVAWLDAGAFAGVLFLALFVCFGLGSVASYLVAGKHN